MEHLTELINVLKTAIEAGQSVTITADDITINYAEGKLTEITINNPSVATEGA